MKNFLDEVVRRRRREIATQRTISTMRPSFSKTPHRLRNALTKARVIKIIGEFKRASPSRGVIQENGQPATTVALYEKAGACAVSILTEPHYFRGSLDDLRDARATTGLPILRKDFIVDELQIYEAAEAGADATLLIVAALKDEELLAFREIAEDQLGLDALVEVHTAEEMLRAVDCGATLVGVNNRDLRTLETSLETSTQLAKLAPAGVTLVSESGISSIEEIKRLQQDGFDAFLIGESLMRADDPVALIRSLRGVGTEMASHV